MKLVYHFLSGVEVVVKTLQKVKGDYQVFSEVHVMMDLEQTNVTQLFQAIKTGKQIYIVMEHMGGEQLLDYIQSGGIKEEEAQRMFRQIL